MHRRIEQAYRHRQALHRPEDSLEIGTLDRQQPVECGLALLQVFGQDHFLHDRQAIGAVEHALGANQADSHGAEFARADCILRRIGVGHDLEFRHFVRPSEERGHFLRELRFHGRHFAGVDMPGAAVDGDHVALMQRGFADDGAARSVVDHDLLAAGNAGFAHAARDHRGMGGLAAAAGENALRPENRDVLRLGFLAYQDHLLARVAARLGGVGVEHDLARGRAGRGGSRAPGICRGNSATVAAPAIAPASAARCAVTHALGNQSFVEHFDRAAHHAAGIHLAVAALQAVQRAALDGEFEILDFAVMRLKLLVQPTTGGRSPAFPVPSRRSA